MTKWLTLSFLALAVALAFVLHPGPWALYPALIFAAVTTTYLYPTNLGPLGGGNVAPTAIQMGPETGARYNEVIATIVATSAADTSAIITHNFGLTASEISQGFPNMWILETTNDTSQCWELSQNSNFTIVGLPGLVGGVRVFLHRDNTIGR